MLRVAYAALNTPALPLLSGVVRYFCAAKLHATLLPPVILRNGGRGAAEVTKNLAFFDRKSTFGASGEILRFAAGACPERSRRDGSFRMTGWEVFHG